MPSPPSTGAISPDNGSSCAHHRRRIVHFNVTEHPTADWAARQVVDAADAPKSPGQNPFVERLIGSMRRECLNHVLVLSEPHLRRILTAYFACYHRARTHLSLAKDAPDVRPVEGPEAGTFVPIREGGGLHHRYVRRAAIVPGPTL